MIVSIIDTVHFVVEYFEVCYFKSGYRRTLVRKQDKCFSEELHG